MCAYESYDEEEDEMPIRTTNNSGSLELCPEGMHVARCCRVIDCGTQESKKYGKRKRMAWIFWELPTVLRGTKTGEDATPHLVGKRYTLSHNPKAILRLDLESWYGRRFDDRQLDERGGFDLETLIGRPALLNVVHSEDGQYANIMSVNPLPKGMTCPAAVHQVTIFGFDPYEAAVFESLSQSMQEFIKGSDEWQLAVNGHVRQAGAQPGAVPTQAGAPEEDLPYARQPQPPVSSRPAPPVKTGGRFDDLEDDIPF